MQFLKKLLGREAAPPPDDPVVLVFIPALVAVLKAAENAKGAPLDEDEVLTIRNRAAVMTVRRSTAIQLADKRGYPDISPEHAWEDWCAVRGQL